MDKLIDTEYKPMVARWKGRWGLGQKRKGVRSANW